VNTAVYLRPLFAAIIFAHYQGVLMDRGDYSSSTDTNVESEHRDATPEETRRIGLIGTVLARFGIVAVLCGAVIVFCCAVIGLIRFG
jgi:hypothetical protein